MDAASGVLSYDLDLSEVTGPFADDGRVTGRVSEFEAGNAFAALLDNPEGYYLRVHSDAYRGGAGRGQLR